MEIDILQEIGLSKGESQAYLTCFKLGLSRVSEISQKSNLNRSNCYGVLNGLVKKGLISKIIKNNKTLFEVGNPKQLLDQYKSKEEELKNFIEELKKTPKEHLDKKRAFVFEGYEGVKQVFEDILNTLDKGSEYFVFGAIDVPAVFERYLVHWTKKRAKRKIKLKIIYNEDAKNFIKQTKNLPLTFIKTLPKEYITPTTINIYGPKTATIVWTEKPMAFVVDNADYTKGFKSYFQMLWKMAK